MSSLDELASKISERLDAADARRSKNREDLQARHEEQVRRLERFGAVATRLSAQLVRPRLERLAGFFENAVLSLPTAGCSQCTCQFAPTSRFPASVKLDVVVAHDQEIENLVVTYSLQILPVFLEFERNDSLFLPLDASDDQQLVSWLDEKLLRFVDTYLELEHSDRYQEQNLVVDPVCGMRINRNDAAGSEAHDGRDYYFCTADCHQKFIADAARFVGAPKP